MAKTIRSEAEKLAGYPVADEIWEYLVDKEFVYDAEISEDLTALVAEMHRLIGPSRQPSRLNAFHTDAMQQIPNADQLHERSLAISDWFAWAASQKTEVARFRRSNLPDGLLSPEQVHDWIATIDQRERPDKWVTEGAITLDEDVVVQVAHEARFSGIPHVLFRWLETDENGELVGAYWPVPPKGTLAEAQQICDSLADWWKWDSYDAMLWLLTGAPAYVWPIRASGRFGWNYTRGMGTYDVHSRITITVDPAVTPEQLGKWWRDLRHRTIPKRYRPLSVKHLRLAKFASTLSDESWELHRRHWNRTECIEHPEWRYDDKRNFHRDTVNAVARLLFVGMKNPDRDLQG
jgi:hypothetical protein